MWHRVVLLWMYLLCGIDVGYNTQYLSFGESWLQYKFFYHEIVDFHHLFKFPMETRHAFIRASVSYLVHHVHGDSLLVVSCLMKKYLPLTLSSNGNYILTELLAQRLILTVKPNGKLMQVLFSKHFNGAPYITLSPFSKRSALIMKQNMMPFFLAFY